MIDKRVKESLLLSLYGELSEREEHLLKEYLESHPQARREYEDLKRFHSLIGSDREAEPPEELIWQARHSLWTKMAAGDARSEAPAKPVGLLGRLSRWWRGGSGSPLLHPALASGAAMLVLGLAAGYALFSPQSGLVDDVAGEGIANVRILQSDPSDPEIEVAFERVSPMRLRGTLRDERLRNILAHAAVNERNTGVRLRALQTLDERAHSAPSDQIKRTLIAALASDDNPGVRRRALEALQRMPFDGEIQQALVEVLQFDPNDGMRVEAINALQAAAIDGAPFDEPILRILRDRIESDDNNYVRRRSETLLKEVEYR